MSADNLESAGSHLPTRVSSAPSGIGHGLREEPLPALAFAAAVAGVLAVLSQVQEGEMPNQMDPMQTHPAIVPESPLGRREEGVDAN